MEKNFYDQPTDSDIKRHEKIEKLTTSKGEDYTTGCLLDYEYTKIIINDVKIFIKKCNSLTKDEILWRSKR